MSIIRRTLAVLNLSTHIQNLIAEARSIVARMTGNPVFPSPTPPLATVSADVAALEAAQTAALTKAKGMADARDAKALIVRTDLGHLRSYVQAIADADPTSAEVTIQSAGMSVKKLGTHAKSTLTATAGSVSGTVHLEAKAAASRAAYEWGSSPDQKTWTSLPTTLQAKTDVSGLTPGSLMYFRVRAVTKAGEGDWSQVVSIIVK